MHPMAVTLLVEIGLAVGLGGLLWPEKVMPVFDVLWFPWSPSYETLRAHSIAAIAFSLLLFL